ncbi:NADH dehydrogenase [ubiquinone] 1 subunit C2 [Tribolium madens]|uniref:NADH dehydrogenase [ubiquinone] 1 subunit C2 n=1 Tax=Tribolium madens TaxID=41895 RepID=UPI001CF759A8|nr:NADH dehydrogenase [ubiquinone] 1 subunit C2 [Tribolium madens]
MASGPKVATTPLEVLTNDETRIPSFMSKYWAPGIGGSTAFVAMLITNWFVKKPLMSGIQVHAFVTVAGAALGKYIDDYRNDYFAERDAAFRHYIQLHPEDFPAFTRKKYSEVLEPWVPIR